MVDVAAQKRNQLRREKNLQAELRKQEIHRTAMRTIQEKFNAEYGFDIDTELGIDRLNKAVATKTGKSLSIHCQELLQQKEGEPCMLPSFS